MPEIRIESLDDVRLDPYRRLKKTNQTRHQDTFVAEGVSVVQRLLDSTFEVESVLVTDSKAERFQHEIESQIPWYRVTRDLASQLVGFPFHMGVLAVGRRRRNPYPLKATPTIGASLVFVLDQIIDQQNMGLLIRIAAGFGADAVVVANGSADPFSRRSIRVSMGNCFFTPVVDCRDGGAECLIDLSEQGYTCCAAVLSDDAADVSGYAFPERTALVFGNESHGVCEPMLSHCDQELKIVMHHGTDSLNVAMAAAVFGYAFQSSQSRGPIA